MKQTVTLHIFREAFKQVQRPTFSYEGLECLFDYLEMLEHCEDEYDLDVTELCGDFSEDTPSQIAQAYDIDLSSVDCLPTHRVDQAISDIVREFLQDQGAFVGETETTIVYRNL